MGKTPIEQVKQDVPTINPNLYTSKKVLYLCLVIVGLALLVLSGAAYAYRDQVKSFLGLNKNTSPSQTGIQQVATQSSTEKSVCADFGVFESQVKLGLNSQEVQFSTSPPDPKQPSSISYIYWKRSQAEPYVSYSVVNSQVLYSSNTDPSILKKALSVSADSLFTKNGFSHKQAADIDYSPVFFQLAYFKGTSLYTLYANQDSTNVVLSLGCGAIEKNKDTYYNAIIQKANYNTGLIASILEIHDRVAEVNVSGITGYAAYWLVDGNKVEMLFQGQDVPSCAVFESIKVGKGFACSDPSNTTHKTVTY